MACSDASHQELNRTRLPSWKHTWGGSQRSGRAHRIMNTRDEVQYLRWRTPLKHLTFHHAPGCALLEVFLGNCASYTCVLIFVPIRCPSMYRKSIFVQPGLLEMNESLQYRDKHTIIRKHAADEASIDLRA
jgi:hypothetical protein